jgi:predicted GIY-YIG superfamily endonuclease
MKSFWVYIVTNPARSVLYIGVTNNLERRMAEHKARAVKGFTQKYNSNYLLYFEETNGPTAAIEREKQLKRWSRAKKEALIDTLNSNREDLSTAASPPVEMTGGGSAAR